jgi:hypothetical protein|eukprot:COSAG02_NODE_24363_length_690_cov_1.483926_2_plen_74_part_00
MLVLFGTQIYEGNPIVLVAGMTFLFNCVLTDPTNGLGKSTVDALDSYKCPIEPRKEFDFACKIAGDSSVAVVA